MDPLEFKWAMGEITSTDYLKARKGRKASVKSERHHSRKKTLPKEDCATIAAFREFLKHAGPAPRPSTPEGERTPETTTVNAAKPEERPKESPTKGEKVQEESR